MIRRLINEVYGQVATCRGTRRSMVIAGNRATTAERDAGRLDRATPQLASDMADQASSTLGSGPEPFDCLRDLRISGGSGCLTSSRKTETQ
jgi:hypothetical protein